MARRKQGSSFKVEIKTKSDSLDKEIGKITGLGRYGMRAGLFSGTIPEELQTGTSIPQYMYYQEYGTETVPESPWFRSAIDDNARDLGAMMERESKAILDGKATPPLALIRLATKTANDLKLSITKFGLIDSGAARNAVTFEIIDGLSIKRLK